MTDKVQKIREEVERIQLYTQSEALKQVLDYIDSLQEEPKFKTGDRIKPIDSCLGSPRTIVDVRDSWYVTDQGTLDFEYEDNWELAEKHKKCMYSQDNYTNEDRKALCDGCEEECRFNKKEEPVSEDLEKAYEKYTDERLKIIRPDIYDSSYSRSTKMTFDLFEGYELETAFEEGANWQKDRMMKEVVSGIVHLDVDKNPYEYVIRTEAVKGMRHGTCLNLIIIKEE